MNSIVISGKVSSDIAEIYEGEKLTETHFVMAVTLTQGKDNTPVTVEVPVTCKGYAANNMDIPDSGWITVNGVGMFTKNEHGQYKLSLVGEVQPAAVNSKLNVVNLIGRLGSDPEIKYLDSGKDITKFSLAVDRAKQVVEWFRVEAWSQKASAYLYKGGQCGVTGQLKYETWTDAEGKFGAAWKVNATRITLVGGKREQSQSNNYGGYEDDF